MEAEEEAAYATMVAYVNAAQDAGPNNPNLHQLRAQQADAEARRERRLLQRDRAIYERHRAQEELDNRNRNLQLLEHSIAARTATKDEANALIEDIDTRVVAATTIRDNFRVELQNSETINLGSEYEMDQVIAHQLRAAPHNNAVLVYDFVTNPEKSIIKERAEQNNLLFRDINQG